MRLARRLHRSTLAACALFALCIVAYLPVRSAGFIWDDDEYVTGNPTLRSPAGLTRIWTELHATKQYYPLTFTTFWFEYQIWNAQPLGYHLANVILHAIGAILLWRVLVVLEAPGALLAACVFAVHPVNVESVAWITERKNVLSGALYFASALAYVRFALNGRSGAWYLGALALFLGALLSKTVTATLPVALFLVLWWKKGRLTWRDVRPLIPFLIAGAIMGSVTSYVERELLRA
ncbi:MAG: glycosyltransferase family 39 protein, partial [Tepidisphaeraceae bacterium]